MSDRGFKFQISKLSSFKCFILESRLLIIVYFSESFRVMEDFSIVARFVPRDVEINGCTYIQLFVQTINRIYDS